MQALHLLMLIIIFWTFNTSMLNLEVE